MKPNIGKKVYIIYQDTISLAEVGYIGAQSFLVSDFENCFADAVEYLYSDYGRTWFTSFEAAKKQILEEFNDLDVKLKLV